MIVTAKTKLKLLKIKYSESYSQKEELNSLEGRLLIAIYNFKGDNNEDINVGQFVMNRFNLLKKNIVLFNSAFKELLESETIKASVEKDQWNWNIKMSQIEVNELISEELENGSFYKFTKKSKVIDKELMAVVDENKNILRFGNWDDDVNITYGYTDELKELSDYKYDELALESMYEIDDTKTLEFKGRGMTSIKEFDVVADMSFKLIANKFIPNNEFTEEYLESVQREEQVELFKTLLRKNNYKGDKNVLSDASEFEEKFSPQNLKAFNENTIVNIYDTYYLMNDLLIQVGKVKEVYVLKNIQAAIEVLRYKKVGREEVANLIIENDNLNEFNLGDEKLTKVVLLKVLNADISDHGFIDKIYDHGVIDKLSNDEIKENISEGLIEMLTDKKLRVLVANDKTKTLKPYLMTMSKVMTDVQVFNYFETVEEAVESKLLDKSETFVWIIKSNEFISGLDEAKYIKKPKELLTDIEILGNMIKASKPFILKEANNSLKSLVKLKDKLFEVTYEDVVAKASLIRNELEAYVANENLIDSIPLGAFAKFVKKISHLNKKQGEKIIDAYKEFSRYNHHNKELKEADPAKLMKNVSREERKVNKITR